MDRKAICYKFLVENKTEHTSMLAEHGLSIYIEADGKKILFDAGATDIVLHNAEVMGVDLKDVDFAAVSHGHYDHTGGFPAFCALNEKAPIYIHKDAFRKSYGFVDGKPEDQMSGICWSDDEKAAIEGRLKYTDGPVYITENICVTGTVPYAEGTNITENFYFMDEAGQWQKDDMCHEQVLVIKEPDGLYIFSGCSHRGVISALEAGKAMFPGERVAVLVAGMHLYSATEEDRKYVVDQMEAEGLDKVMPVHCTGIKAICDLKTRLGDACTVAVAGDVYNGR
ncbi:MAG: MBL fold metallo-hydrolase [Bacillota bacterium]|nr:MBL fold metallo-hydrolase [Bacillota bacterium]